MARGNAALLAKPPIPRNALGHSQHESARLCVETEKMALPMEILKAASPGNVRSYRGVGVIILCPATTIGFRLGGSIRQL